MLLVVLDTVHYCNVELRNRQFIKSYSELLSRFKNSHLMSVCNQIQSILNLFSKLIKLYYGWFDHRLKLRFSSDTFCFTASSDLIFTAELSVCVNVIKPCLTLTAQVVSLLVRAEHTDNCWILHAAKKTGRTEKSSFIP